MTSWHAEQAILALGLLAPLGAAAALWLMRARTTAETAAMSLAFFWTLPALLLVGAAASRFDWWSFRGGAANFGDMPLELFLGWAFLWGPLAALALARLPLAAALGVAFIFDCATMPLCAPVIRLGDRWLAGEVVAFLVVLLPAQLIARWTAGDRRLFARAALQVLLFGGILVLLVPAIVAASTGERVDISSMLLQLFAPLPLVALSAVQELAARGGGTPYPLDPPRRLVTSGVYRYIRNPMQATTAAAVIAVAAMAGSVWLIMAGVIMTIFSLGFARWSEESDLDERFGEAWHRYRRAVRAWLPRWRPYAEPGATIYIAESCDVCNPIAQWLRRRHPVGLTIAAAERHPSRDLTRVTYEPADGAPPEDGVRALARALEHLHLGWAVAGAIVRLPLVRELAQLVTDAAGGGPRPICRVTSP